MVRKFLPILAGLGLLLAGCGAAQTAGSSSPATAASAASVYVFNSGNNSVSVVNPATDKVVRTVSIGTTSSFPSATWGASSGYVMLPHNGNLAVLQLSDLKVVDNLPLADAHGVHATETPNGQMALVALPNKEQILYLNLNPKKGALGKQLGAKPTMKMGPAGIATDPNGGYVFVPGNFAAKNCVVNLADISKTPTICTANSPVPHPALSAVAPNGKWWAVANDSGGGSITLYNVTNPKKIVQTGLVSSIQGLGQGPYFPIFSPDSKYLLAVGQSTGKIAVIDPQTRKVVRTVTLPGGAAYAAYSPSGQQLYVALPQSNAVAAVNMQTFQVSGPIKVGPHPVSIVAGSYSFLQAS